MAERKIRHVKDVFSSGKAGEFKYTDYDGTLKKDEVETTEVVDTKLQTQTNLQFNTNVANPQYKKKSFSQLADRNLLGQHGKGPAPQQPRFGNYEPQNPDIEDNRGEGILPGVNRKSVLQDENHNDHTDSDYDEGFPDVNGFMSSMSSASKQNPLFMDKPNRDVEHSQANRNTPAFMTVFTKMEIEDKEAHRDVVTSNGDVNRHQDLYAMSDEEVENVVERPKPPPRKSKNKMPPNNEKSTKTDDNSYTEEEEIMEFFSESDDDSRVSRQSVYQQYDGEDYGKYIESDPEDDSGIGEDGTTRRKVPPKQPTYQQQPQRQSSRGGIALKKKLDKSITGAHKPKRYGSSLHNYSYADTKIGNEDVYGKKMSLLQQREKPEENRENTKLWWRYDMLSAQTSDLNNEVLYKSQRKQNAEELLTEISENKQGKQKRIVPSRNYNQYDNFESLRKEMQYDAVEPKKEGTLKRLTGSVRSRATKDINIYNNAAANPLMNFDDEQL